MSLFRSWFEDIGAFAENDNNIPTGWVPTRLSERLTTSTSSINPQKMGQSKVWHYSIPAYDAQGLPTFDETANILSNKYLVPDDAILVSKLNPDTKRIWKTMGCFENAICSTEFIVFQPINKKHGAFYFLLFNTKAFIDFLVSNATGSTNSRMRVKPASSLDFTFFCPPDVQLDRFCSLVEPLLSQIDSNLLEIRKLSELAPIAVAKLIDLSR